MYVVASHVLIKLPNLLVFPLYEKVKCLLGVFNRRIRNTEQFLDFFLPSLVIGILQWEHIQKLPIQIFFSFRVSY
jgi:hypothetical protein